MTSDLTKYKIENILESVGKGHSISDACEAAKISRPSFYRWLNESEENKKRFYEIHDSKTLAVEDALYHKAISGDVTACIFWLKSRAQDRWAERRYDGGEDLRDRELTLYDDPTPEIRQQLKRFLQ